jgi:hypothetical protein
MSLMSSRSIAICRSWPRVKQDALTAQATDRLADDQRLILQSYSSCMRWLTGETPAR